MGQVRKHTRFMVLILTSFLCTFTCADETMPKFSCTLTDQMLADVHPGDAKTDFPKTTPMIYLICTSSDVVKGQKVKATWIAADTHNVAPANYKIDEKGFDVTKDLSTGQVWTFTGSLSKPNNNWPAGSYHVDLYVDQDLSQSIKFTIQ